MHFSIPDTQEVKDENGSSYIAYSIHVNGAFHCLVRYRQLHNLHEQLRKEYGPNALPSFPPKKLLPLTPAQTEERRAHLEKYIQHVSQDSKISTNEIFIGFLLNAQQETQNAKEEEKTFDIHLMNWQPITVQIYSTDRTALVLEAVAKALNLQPSFICYFCLYLIRKEENELIIERRLQEFEAPYLSWISSGPSHYLVLRKSYWDPAYDDDVLEDRTVLNLLYVQAVSDVERGWILTNKETQRQLATLQAKGSKKEYLQFARTLKYYGYIQFRPCFTDYPQPNTKVIVCAGNRELNFRIRISHDQMREVSFRVTRIRSWRITTSLSDRSAHSTNGDVPRLELSFEYLLSKGKLQWVTLVSEQAILISVCLQGMVEELLMKRNGTKFRHNSEHSTRRGSWSYMKRDGSSYQIAVSRSASTDGFLDSPVRDDTKQVGTKDQMKKITEKISSVSIKPSTRPGAGALSSKPLVENDAFEGIGDDDL